MKPQDIVFLAMFSVLFFIRIPKVFLVAGIFCYILAIPLFSAWIFFTAERLTWYGSVFILASLLISQRKECAVKLSEKETSDI